MKFIIEQSAYSGVLKIAGKVAHDMELVTGIQYFGVSRQ